MVFRFSDCNVHIFLLLNNTTILLNAICLLNVFNVTFHLTHFRYQPPHHLSTSVVTPSPLPSEVWLLAEPPPSPLMDSSVTTPLTSAMDRGSRLVESRVNYEKKKKSSVTTPYGMAFEITGFPPTHQIVHLHGLRVLSPAYPEYCTFTKVTGYCIQQILRVHLLGLQVMFLAYPGRMLARVIITVPWTSRTYTWVLPSAHVARVTSTVSSTNWETLARLTSTASSASCAIHLPGLRAAMKKFGGFPTISGYCCVKLWLILANPGFLLSISSPYWHAFLLLGYEYGIRHILSVQFLGLCVLSLAGTNWDTVASVTRTVSGTSWYHT